MKKTEYRQKLLRMEQLLELLTIKNKLTKTQSLELDKISDEIASYEEEKYPFKADNLKEMIELRMYQRKLKQKDLAKLLDTTPSRISEIINGKRGLTIQLAKNLYKKLNIDADLILSD